MEYAFIDNGRVAEIYGPRTEEGREIPIEERFHPDHLARCVVVPEGAAVSLGDTYDGKAFGKPAPEPQPDLAEGATAERDRLLAASDWTQLADVPEETRVAWAAYRQELRNVPQQKTFPKKIKWPEAPQ